MDFLGGGSAIFKSTIDAGIHPACQRHTAAKNKETTRPGPPSATYFSAILA
jgi:hypothetical protein